MAQSFATTPKVQSALLSRADLRQAYCNDVSATHHRAIGKTAHYHKTLQSALLDQIPRANVADLQNAQCAPVYHSKNLDQGNRPQAIRQDSSEVLLILII